jgi:membrane-associated phospholipid phosphatase
MPSLHVGWAIWSGVLLAMYARRRWVRILGGLYPAVTSLVVMATGNHYLLDVFAGALVIAWGALGALAVDHWRRSKPVDPATLNETPADTPADLELAG